eukprot:g7431.t1
MGNGVGSLIQKKDIKNKAGNNAGEPHQQWRKPKDLKTIKQQNEQRRRQEEAELDRKKKEEERLRRLKEEWEKEKESGHRHAEEIDGYDDGEGGGPPDGGQGGYAQQYGNPEDVEHGIYNDVGNDHPGYDGSENYYYEDPAEQALRRAETVGLFNIMEHDEVVPSEYQKREKMKELQKQQNEEEKKRWETQKMLQERQRGSGRQAVSASGFVSAGGNDRAGGGDQQPPGSGQRQSIGFGRKNPTLEMTNSLGKNSSGLDRSPNAAARRGSGRSTPTAMHGGNNSSQFDSDVNSAMMLEDEVNKHEKLAVGNLENTIVDAVGRIWEQIMTERKKGGRENSDVGGKTNYSAGAGNVNATSNQSNPRLGTANSTTVSDSGFGLNRPGANSLNPAVLLQIKREVEAAAQAIESCENDLETFEQQKYAQIHDMASFAIYF